MFKFLKRLFKSPTTIDESEKRILTYTRVDIVKLTSNESNIVVAYYLQHLMDSCKIKPYFKVKQFITKYNPTHSTRTECPYGNLVKTNEIIKLGHQMKVLHYKCEDEQFIEWITSVD